MLSAGSIKFRNKQKKKEKETHTKKAKWQDFVSSKKKKKKSGMMTSLKRESIFKSPGMFICVPLLPELTDCRRCLLLQTQWMERLAWLVRVAE